MSYLQPSSTDEEPFAIVGMSSTTGSFSTARWDQSSAAWVDRDTGTTGRGFLGEGYINMMLAGTSSMMLRASVGVGSPQTQQAGVYSGVVAARAGSDDAAFCYGNSTERTVETSYFGSYAFLNLLSRCTIMRMER